MKISAIQPFPAKLPIGSLGPFILSLSAGVCHFSVRKQWSLIKVTQRAEQGYGLCPCSLDLCVFLINCEQSRTFPAFSIPLHTRGAGRLGYRAVGHRAMARTLAVRYRLLYAWSASRPHSSAAELVPPTHFILVSSGECEPQSSTSLHILELSACKASVREPRTFADEIASEAHPVALTKLS
jgi:hypothetical protein